MKKFLKLQAKKSVSLFLAVLMVLSCWVWMAPEEAQAASAAEGYYRLRVRYNVDDNGTAADGSNYFNITYVENGTGTTRQTGNQQMTTDLTSGYKEQEIWVKGFPTQIYHYTKAKDDGCGTSNDNGFGFADYNLQLYDNTKSSWINILSKAETWDVNESGVGYTFSVSAAQPAITAFDTTWAATTLACPVYGSTSTASTTEVEVLLKDQYGVRWLNDFSYDALVGTTSSKDTDNIAGTLAEKGIEIVKNSSNNKKLKVTINSKFQENYNPDTGKDTVDIYLIANVGELSISRKITVSYTKLSYTFDANGSIPNMTAKVYDKNGTYRADNDYVLQGYYGDNVTNAPTNTSVDAGAGYTFLGFWTTPQPSDANSPAYFFAKEADFAYPISSEEYKNLTTGEDGNKYDADGKMRYDAGEQWSPDTDITISKNKTFYGWWCSKDIEVKFYDVDGKFLGKQIAKYGQGSGEITWPDSNYSTYTSGAFTYTVDANVWVNFDGTKVYENSGIFTKDLVLTPQLNDGTFKNTYNVVFVNPLNGNNLSQSKAYNYRADLSTIRPATQNIPVAIANDTAYSYEFIGWSSVAPSTGAYYHVLLEEADFDVNGNAVGVNSDWIVRSDVTYYAVYRRHIKSYVVEFSYKDATGAAATRRETIKYGDKLVPPVAYVPNSYTTEGFGYNFTKWSYTGAAGAAELGYSDELLFTSDFVRVLPSALDDGVDVVPFTLTAGYGAPIPRPYTVTFTYVDDEGDAVEKAFEVKNGETITADIVSALDPATEWDHDDKLYTYSGLWKITAGAGKLAGSTVTVDEEIMAALLADNFSPTSNVSFEAVYANPKNFYIVTYIDGAQKFEERVLQDSNVPVWMIKETDDNGTPDDPSDDKEIEKPYTPADYEGDGGEYKFQGWFDEKQTDTTFTTVNGKKYTSEDKVTGNLTLYPQYKFVADKYTLTFLAYDGKTQLGAGQFEKGWTITPLVAEMERAANARPADNTYRYEFIGWDKPVPDFCEGYDVTFTALYKKHYIYYDATWYNSRLVDGNWVADKTTAEDDEGNTYEVNLLATTHHTYNSKLYTPSVDSLVCLENAPEGQTYVFAGWYYNDNGVAKKYERGMLITAEMEFYATYKLSAKVHTVTTVVDGESTEYDVADGETIVNIISDPQSGYLNATEHREFDKWYTDAALSAEFDMNTAVTADITLYAKYIVSDHEYLEGNTKVTKEPTYYDKGEKISWCECDATLTEKKEEIALLTDGDKPTATIYLGNLGSWSSEGTPANVTDGDPITLYANALTNVIITANDTGIGVKYIRAFAFPAETVLTAENYGAAQQLAINVYTDETQALTNNANFAVKLGDIFVADLDETGKVQYDENNNIKYKELQSGESYIIYYYVTDKAGNQLNRKVRTAKFYYDDTAPEITLDGKTGDANVKTVTYCEKVVIKGIENGSTLVINGEAKALTSTSANGTANYTVDQVGNYYVEVTDKAGNTAYKKFKVAEHDYYTTEKAATCGAAGYKKVVCLVCDTVKTDETYDALEHVLVTENVPADCITDGYDIITCENCDFTDTVSEDEDGNKLYPALEHEFELDADNNVVYVTVTASTCSTKGSAEAKCKKCNGELEGGYLTKELELDATKHEKIETSRLEPTCTEAGHEKTYCAKCNAEIKVTPIEANGHEDGVWVVTTPASCYQKGTEEFRCPVCGTGLDGDDEGEEADTKEIPATEEHIKYVIEKVESEPGKQGYVKYGCKTDGCTWTHTKNLDKVEAFTVIFQDEAGNELAKITKDEGEYIAKTEVTAPDKAETVEYEYSFAGWVDTADGKTIVKLPLEVTKNMTVKASYKATKIKYTHTFKVPTTWTETLAADDESTVFATLVGAYGDERVPTAKPVFKHKDATTDAALKKLYTFEFIGWKGTESEAIVTDFTVKGDEVYTAVFKATPIKYTVTYYNGTEFVWQTEVEGGATNVAFGGTAPTKAFDADYHYAFANKWYTDATLKTEYKGEAITANTRLYAGFTATAHSNYVVNNKVGSVVEGSDPEVKDGIIQKADCLLPELTEYICSCGHTKTEQTNDKLGHSMSEYVYDEASGKMVSACTRDNCDYTESYNASVTVTFADESGLAIYFVTVKKGEKVKFQGEYPEKAPSTEYTYTFAGWKGADGTVYAKDAEIAAGEEDATYTAYYTATKRTYTVKYVDSRNNYAVIETYENLEYGAAVPAFKGDLGVLVVPEYTTYEHYVFDKWNVAANAKVTGDMYITPEFKAVAHVTEKGTEVGATCTEKGGIEYKCKDCEYRYVDTDANLPALGHIWDEGTVTLEPNYEQQIDGVRTYKCIREGCDCTKEEPISGKSRSIKVTVKDNNGNPIEHAEVRLLKDGTVIDTNTTDNNGVTIFTGLSDGNYSIYVVDTDRSYNDIVVNEDGSVKNGDIVSEPEKVEVDNSCKCTCHKDTFWGIIFRFFQKIIKLFTGKPTCCACPDGRI